MPKSTVIAEAAAAVRAATERAQFAEAELARITEEMIARCVDAGKYLHDWQQTAWSDLFSGKLIEVQETGRQLKDAYRETLGLFEKAASRLADSQGRDYTIEGAEEFQRLQKKIKRLAADFDKRWPLFDLTELQQAIERADKGEVLTAEEFRRALLSDD
jgi:hypothetical protein